MMTSPQTQVDAEGIATFRWGGNDGTARSLTPDLLAEFERRWSDLTAREEVRGVVFAGPFPGGVDIDWLHACQVNWDRDSVAELAEGYSRLLDRIEASDLPSVAALTHDAMDAGFDLVLACQVRLVADGAPLRLGVTQSMLGLPPVGGAAGRLTRLFGNTEAIALLQRSDGMFAQAAVAAGIAETATATDVVEAAATRALLEQATECHAPGATVMRRTLRPDSESLRHARAFTDAAMSPTATRMVRTLGLTARETRRLVRRPAAPPRQAFNRIGVLGAGLMGGGIALVAARAGLQVELIDVDMDRAQAGYDRLCKAEDTLVVKGRADPAEVAETLARITPGCDFSALAGVQIVVEAVFEDRSVKAEATRRAEAHMPADAVFATNTSTLPIHGLAKASVRPAQFIGLHFFSPVPRMPLLEIIRGAETSDDTLARSMDFAARIGKTPILVRDARGFYTTRVVMAYQAEAYEMVAEGHPPERIESAARLTGMPVPPLALSDAVGLALVNQIEHQTAADLGDAYRLTRGYALVRRIVEDEGRTGKQTGGGFFDYDEKGRAKPWAGLSAMVDGKADTRAPLIDLRDRLLAAQCLETARCLEEGVIDNLAEADVGAVLGWGFASWTGGPIAHILAIGPNAFAERCTELASLYGRERLVPSRWVTEVLPGLPYR